MSSREKNLPRTSASSPLGRSLRGSGGEGWEEGAWPRHPACLGTFWLKLHAIWSTLRLQRWARTTPSCEMTTGSSTCSLGYFFRVFWGEKKRSTREERLWPHPGRPRSQAVPPAAPAASQGVVRGIVSRCLPPFPGPSRGSQSSSYWAARGIIIPGAAGKQALGSD